MSAQGPTSVCLASAFRDASAPSAAAQPRRKTKPFAIRFTETEVTYLKSKAGRRPLGAWCRDKLLGKHAERCVELKHPKLDDHQYAALLSALGESRMSSNLNQLAKHATMGTLDVSQDTEQQLHDAYAAIIAMRDVLLTALQVKLR
ncbi:MAG: hypothetical protein AB8B57_03150 [Congregibacter sp.]